MEISGDRRKSEVNAGDKLYSFLKWQLDGFAWDAKLAKQLFTTGKKRTTCFYPTLKSADWRNK